jgi:uncharacterized membrane protein
MTKENQTLSIRKIAYLVGMILILWVLVPFFFIYIVVDKNNFGIYGDMYGGINALFTGLAFVGVITAIILQMKELALQREELVLTRSELTDTKDEHCKARKENAFFQMVALHNEIVKNASGVVTTYDIEEDEARKYTKQGKRFFQSVLAEFRGYYSPRKMSDYNPDIENIRRKYQKLFKKYEPVLGHYFRNIYTIIKFIDDEIACVTEQRKYIRILRAQLSASEHILIFYNCLSERGENFKKLAEKHRFFNNIQPDLLHHDKHLLFMKEGAYGEEEVEYIKLKKKQCYRV